jgi:hypothetical protein
MLRVRLFSRLLVLLVGVGCGRETFNLLPPDEQASDDDGMAGDGPVGSGGSGYGGSAGSGFPTSGRGGREEPPPPIPDCPESETECIPCTTSRECPIGRFCDGFRNYCAPYCDGDMYECFQPPVCDYSRRVCVECTIDTHCRDMLECEGGKCVPGTPPECFSNSQCLDPSQPVCVGYVCRPCFNNVQCGPEMQCTPAGRCEPDLPGPPQL